MYYDDFVPSDGVWYQLQEMLRQIESYAELNEFSHNIENLDYSQKNQLKEFLQTYYNGLSNVPISRGASYRLESLDDRRQVALNKLRDLLSCF
ncbi:MAG: hypothetical protein FWE19_03990 [Oscillospiraceae bacterium]|nr:hypothetical protein [Oscillospiraceae bacterium]